MASWIRNACRATLILILFCFMSAVVRAEAQGAVCDDGYGRFETQFPTGVSVLVGAGHSGGFGTRTCDAILSWSNDRLVVVPTAAQVDIDVLGADLGLGLPVVAFQVRQADHDWHSTYLIYSLEKKPHLLKTITGGDFYRAVDADFNKRIAIWTTDAVAVDGFDGLTYADYDFAPTIVLGFDHGSLVDVSAHYWLQYDRQIAEVRSQLSGQALSDFRKSDGRLAFGSTPAMEWARLRKTKAKVLEIVWAYLYSGRQQQAWAKLDKAWPPADEERVKAEILAARAKGIDAQVASVASAKLPPKWQETPFVYELLKTQPSGSKPETKLNYGVPGVSGNMEPETLANPETSAYETAADKAPVAILLWRPPPSPSEEALAQSQETVRLIIDEAGKVRSAKMVLPREDSELLDAAKNWKFIPAFKDGRPVAYNLKMDVSPYR